MDHLADELGVVPLRLDSLRRAFGAHDLVALIQTVRLLRQVRPAILHTHAAKAGAIGRVAALLLGPAGPPIRIHTFHGHVLTGYFGQRRSALFVAVERLLARGTTRLVAVSDEVRDDLIALRVAPARAHLGDRPRLRSHALRSDLRLRSGCSAARSEPSSGSGLRRWSSASSPGWSRSSGWIDSCGSRGSSTSVCPTSVS